MLPISNALQQKNPLFSTSSNYKKCSVKGQNALVARMQKQERSNKQTKKQGNIFIFKETTVFA